MAKDHISPVPPPIARGRYVARFTSGSADLVRAQRLRHLQFVQMAGRADLAGGIESDRFDALCDHGVVEDADGAVVCCFRVMAFASGADISQSYSAQYYDLKRFSMIGAPLVELGRFCVHPDASDPDVLRLAWGLLAAFVDLRGAGMLFGCSSISGTDASAYSQEFDVLAAGHLAPDALRPEEKAPECVRYAQTARAVTDRRAGLAQVPALLRTYLSMGGWVSDHAVIDRDMNKLHVFTALEIASIPPLRARAFRAVAQPANVEPPAGV